MCFLNEPEYYCQIFECYERISDGSIICYECGSGVPKDAQYTWRYWQEHEECQYCDLVVCTCEDGPDFGEVSSMPTCMDCENFRRVVRMVEIDEGCAEYESEPSHGEMFFECGENGKHSCVKYLRRLRKEFPETVESGYFKLAVSKLL